MTSTLNALRATAATMAIVAIIDPPVSRTRLVPPAVDVRVDARSLASVESRLAAADAQQRLQTALARDVTLNADAPPAARVVIGGAAQPFEQDQVPLSSVTLAVSSAPDARIVAVKEPAPVPVGWSTELSATIEARGLAGKSSAIVLEQQGTEIARINRTWSQDRERADVRLPYAPTKEGVSRVTLCVQPTPSEVNAGDNAIDVAVAAIGRRLRILAHESRPSWISAFVRRVLENNPTFDVATLVRSSRSIAVRGGAPPTSLASGSLNTYDAVIVGAPEDLTSAEVDALETFARARGGTVVLLPDRRPSGRYLALLRHAEFDEVLVQNPLEVRAAKNTTLRAGEFAVPRSDLPDAETLASVDYAQAAKPLVFSRPLGTGTVIFSGALDAWRYRDQSAGGFARFWQSVIAEAALRAPSKVEVEIEPAIAAPGEDVIVRARLRGTELKEAGGRTIVPAMSARLIRPNGGEERIRLWPSVEQGLFEGVVKAPEPGAHDLQVAGAGATADVVLLSAAAARSPSTLRDESGRAAILAKATGGVVVASDSLGPLEQQLRSLPKSESRFVLHPARSPWFAMLFALLLCAEWALRRKRGLA